MMDKILDDLYVPKKKKKMEGKYLASEQFYFLEKNRTHKSKKVQ